MIHQVNTAQAEFSPAPRQFIQRDVFAFVTPQTGRLFDSPGLSRFEGFDFG
jgi:hypothetical protein